MQSTIRRATRFSQQSASGTYRRVRDEFGRRHFGFQQRRHASSKGSLKDAWNSTRIRWRPIPVALGVAFLGVFQFIRVQQRELKKDEEELRRGTEDDNGESLGRPRRRERVRPSGPWTVQIMSTIPLKAVSRWWGWFNRIDIPYYLRIPGFKLYGFVFGVNFDEIEEPDLHNFRNLAEFFYRTLKPGARPLDNHPNALLSPADGRVVQFGTIEHGEVEQVKGVTYSVDALLGAETASRAQANHTGLKFKSTSTPGAADSNADDSESIHAEEEFARVNGISYTLPNLFSGSRGNEQHPNEDSAQKSLHPEGPSDQSTESKSSSEAAVSADLALSPNAPKPWYSPASAEAPTALYYCVIYLAPGDYHRFHSPVSWVVESRRHFAGELYSVSPYLQRTLPGLFTLNERVVLLGRWKFGFFSYTPVGATNVGSIIINFDKELRTNSLLTDTLADRAAEQAAKKGIPYSGYAEATYTTASKLLAGHALRKGEEMGGFQLGSTIVLVFEAPVGSRPSFDEGFTGDSIHRKGGWQWNIEKGKKVRVGEKLGFVEDE